MANDFISDKEFGDACLSNDSSRITAASMLMGAKLDAEKNKRYNLFVPESSACRLLHGIATGKLLVKEK